MKKNVLKKAAVLVSALFIVAAVPGCSSSGGDAAGASKTNTEAKEMTNEEYVEKVTSTFDKITEASNSALAGVDQNDMQAVLTATKGMIDEVKPLYVEISALKAPADYTELQTKIKDGCDASVEVLELSYEMMEMGANPEGVSDADAQKKLTEMQTKLTEAQPKLTDLQTAINELQTAGGTEAPAEGEEAK